MPGRFVALFSFVALTVTFFAFIGFQYINWSDDGMIVAGAWRVIHGQLPYRDFIYIRPPLSLYLHALPLLVAPDTWQLILGRAFSLLEIATASVLAARIVDRSMSLEKYGLDLFGLASLGLVYSLQRHLFYPWYTVDAVFFAVLGLFLILGRKSKTAVYFGFASLALSALCKQTFAPVAVFALFYCWKSKRNLRVAILGATTPLLLFILWLSFSGLLFAFCEQVLKAGQARDVLSAGVFRYMRSSLFLPCAAALTFFFIRLFKRTLEFGWLGPLFFGLGALLPLIHFLKHGNFEPSQFDYPQLLFLLALFCFSQSWAMGLLLLVTWLSSITTGVMTPLLFSLPLLMGAFVFIKDHLKFKHLRLFYATVLGAGLVIGLLHWSLEFPNSSRQYDLGESFPKLRHLRGGRFVAEKFQELKALVSHYGNNFKILPTIPHANFLAGSMSPIPVDVAQNLDTGPTTGRLIAAAAASGAVMFIENPYLEIPAEGYFGSPLLVHIRSHWCRLETRKHFTVYRKNCR